MLKPEPFDWSGETFYKCPACEFDSQSAERVSEHIANLHSSDETPEPLATPKASKKTKTEPTEDLGYSFAVLETGE